MRTYVGDQEAVSLREFEELAFGLDAARIEFLQDLVFGEPGESRKHRQARVCAARDIIADIQHEDPELAHLLELLLNSAPLITRRLNLRPERGEVAA